MIAMVRHFLNPTEKKKLLMLIKNRRNLIREMSSKKYFGKYGIVLSFYGQDF